MSQPNPKTKTAKGKPKTHAVITTIQNRISARIEALHSFDPSPLDNFSNEVKTMREIEASRLRAIIQEQKDLVEILTPMLANA